MWHTLKTRVSGGLITSFSHSSLIHTKHVIWGTGVLELTTVLAWQPCRQQAEQEEMARADWPCGLNRPTPNCLCPPPQSVHGEMEMCREAQQIAEETSVKVRLQIHVLFRMQVCEYAEVIV